MTKILPCTCTSTYQDAKYGKGKRVHNTRLKPGESRCTICKQIKTGG